MCVHSGCDGCRVSESVARVWSLARAWGLGGCRGVLRGGSCVHEGQVSASWGAFNCSCVHLRGRETSEGRGAHQPFLPISCAGTPPETNGARGQRRGYVECRRGAHLGGGDTRKRPPLFRRSRLVRISRGKQDRLLVVPADPGGRRTARARCRRDASRSADPCPSLRAQGRLRQQLQPLRPQVRSASPSLALSGLRLRPLAWR